MTGTPRDELIRERAHAIWEREGRPEGEDSRHWQQATAEIDAESAAKAAKVSKPAAKKVAKAVPSKATKPAAKRK